MRAAGQSDPLMSVMPSAVELTADLAARKQRRMHIHIGHAFANGGNQFGEFTRGDPLPTGANDVRRQQSTGDLARSRARRRQAGGVGIGYGLTQENADPAIDALLTEMDVCLPDLALQAFIAEPVSDRAIVDAG